MAKPELKFYDLKKRKKFTTKDYTVVMKSGRHFAKTKAPSGVESWVVISKENYNKCK